MRRARRSLLLAALVAAFWAGPSAPAQACYGSPCDEISDTCYVVQSMVSKPNLHCGLG